MILGFKKEFVAPILAGTKIHTIRRDANNRWENGMKIHFATGVRTKDYKQFKVRMCTGIQPIQIRPLLMAVRIGSNRIFQLPDIQFLAKKDGFRTVLDFFQFFQDNYGNFFEGKIIHWTNFRY